MQLLPTCIHIWCTACGGKQPLCSRRSPLLKTLLSESMMAHALFYMFTHMRPCVCVCDSVPQGVRSCLCICTQMSASLSNTIVHCHLQSTAALENLHTHTHTRIQRKSQQIKTLHSIKSSEKPVYWWSGVKTTGGCGPGRWRERGREGGREWERWGVRVVETVKQSGSGRLQGLLLSAIVKELGGIIGLLSSMRSMHF